MKETAARSLCRTLTRLAVGAVVLAGSSCQRGITIDVRVTGRPSDASTLLVTATLGDLQTIGIGSSLTQAPDRVKVQLLESPTGHVHLYLSGQDLRGCEVAAGDGTVEVAGPGTYPLEVALNKQDGCTLQVERIGPGSGRVSSTPSGIDCGSMCSQTFERGQVVSLSATTADFFGGWFADAATPSCSGRVGCAITIGSGRTRVRTQFIHPDSCTPSGWCIEDSLPAASTPSHLYSLWGSGRDDAWAVGDNGTILHSDGVLWNASVSGTTRALRSVWGSSGNDVWAVGELGAILHWNGRSWTPSAAPTPAWLNAIWGNGRSDVWAVGDGGTMASRN